MKRTYSQCLEEALEILCDDPNATDEMIDALAQELFEEGL